MQDAITNYATALNATGVIYSRVNHVAQPVVGGSGWTQYAVLRSRRD
jgi:hypothetical protein